MSSPHRGAAPASSPHALALSSLPTVHAERFAPSQSPEGRRWIEALPSLIADLADAWGLVIESASVRCGYHAVVVPVRLDGQAMVLKLRWPPEEVAEEADALAAWMGRGAVIVAQASAAHGALLLERLDATSPLSAVPILEALEIAGRLIRTLAIPGPGTFLTTQHEATLLSDTLAARQRALGDPVPSRWLDRAAGLGGDLATTESSLLVHGDLHFGNVFARRRAASPWAAIDPKPRVGDPERSAPELLWTRVDELADARRIVAALEALSAAGDLDLARATSWSYLPVPPGHRPLAVVACRRADRGPASMQEGGGRADAGPRVRRGWRRRMGRVHAIGADVAPLPSDVAMDPREETDHRAR